MRLRVEGKKVKWQTNLSEQTINKMFARAKHLNMYMGRYLTELIDRDCRDKILKRGDNHG